MKRLLLTLATIGLVHLSIAQVKSPVILVNAAGQKVLADKTYTFNIGSPIPYFYRGSTNTLLQVGFPYNVLYMDRTFPGELSVSKGYFPGYIQLRWEVTNNAAKITHFEIYRKKLNETESVWIDNVQTTARKWEDLYSEANEVYEYTLKAIGIAGGEREGYTFIKGIGFRSPLATITGRVSFSGGNGVGDVVISSSTNDAVPSKSLGLSGSSFLAIPQFTAYDFSGGFSLQAYTRLNSTANGALISKKGNFSLTYQNQKFRFTVGTQFVELPFTDVTGSFVQVTAVYGGGKAQLFVPFKANDGSGGVIDSLLSASANITNTIPANSDTIFIGKAGTLFLNGNIDEVRIWRKALDPTEIKRDFNRYISGNNDNLYAYLRMNEGFGTYTYDISKSGSKFNENHGKFVGSGVAWSNSTPTIDQLGYKGITDPEGNYIISGIPFLTGGSPYKFTPMLAPHQFDPGYKILYLSEGSEVQNNINFTDISSFFVSGSVVYTNTTLGVKKVKVLVDGKPVYGKDNREVETDEKGKFQIEVPIGYHYISLHKDGHIFADNGRWPFDPAQPNIVKKHNFNQNLTFPQPFNDNTLVTVIGRVTGGTANNDQPLAFGKSTNNIGKATLTLNHGSFNPELTFDNLGKGLGFDTVAYKVKTEIKINGDTTKADLLYRSWRDASSVKIFTDPATGEFVAKMIPEKFSIVDIDVDNDAANIVRNFFGNRVMDFSATPSLKFEYVFDKNGKKLDSVAYHYKFNYLFLSTPEIEVTNVDDTLLLYGEKTIEYTNPVDGVTSNIVVAEHFRFPVFTMFNTYKSKISVFESYHNFDTGTSTRQPVKEATIGINNNLALKDNVKTLNINAANNGSVIYEFKVGTPETAKNSLTKTSFTKTLQMNVTVDGNIYAWKPGNDFYRAYILGQKPKGNNFYTKGPQLVDMVLRDPPGSNSFAYIEKGSTYSNAASVSSELLDGTGTKLKIMLGASVVVGGGLAGPQIEQKTENSGEVGLTFTTKTSNEGEYIEEFTFNERVETSADPGMVGSMADIYIGKSFNYFYGETDNLTILPSALAQTNGVIRLDDDELSAKKEFTLGITEGFMLNPDNSDTYFKYTQDHILYRLIPELESRKVNLFMTSKRKDGRLKYTSHLPSNDIRYGVADYYQTRTQDTDTIIEAYFTINQATSSRVLSYSFRPDKTVQKDLNNVKDKEIYEVDSVRYFNDQIGIWVDAIRGNEAEKALAIKSNKPEKNISFDGGVGSIAQSMKQVLTYNKTEKRVKTVNFTGQGSMGFAFNDVGLIVTSDLKVEHNLGIGSKESHMESVEYGYVLSDGNAGDYYSINVYNRKNNGMYTLADLRPSTVKLPGGFEWGILGGVVGGALGGGIATGVLQLMKMPLGAYNATGGGVVIGMAAAQAISAGLGYIPYTKFNADFSKLDTTLSCFDLSSPIFSSLGGVTSCPFQDAEYTAFYRDEKGDSVVIHKRTLKAQDPSIAAEPTSQINIPVNSSAIFNLQLTNNSESGDNQWYIVKVDEATNPNGAIIQIDGSPQSKTILVPANSTINKTLTLTPSNLSIMEYKNIGIIIHSDCQFDPTDNRPDISDTVFLSAHFQPACTNIKLLEPLDKWVVNVTDNDTMTIRIGGYNLSYDAFRSFRFEYKPSAGNVWVPVKYFVNDPLLANKDGIADTALIENKSFVVFDWDMTKLKDRQYDIRAVSICSNGTESYSAILTGILDGQRPQVFGTPQPADNILNIDDEISVQFNEPIERSLLDQFNFEVKGTLNYFELKHEAFSYFNGQSDFNVIPEGISLTDKSFTIEFWAKPDFYKNSVLISQGSDPVSNLEIGLLDGYKVYFKIGNTEFNAALQFTSIVPPEAWQHLAFVYDNDNGDIFIYQNDKIILEKRGFTVNYNNSGPINIGKSSVTGQGFYNGSLYELRIWSKILPIGDVYAKQYVGLSGNEPGLYGYWPMNEAFGELARDKAANRHMEIRSTWEAYPGGSAWNFAGNNFLGLFTGYFAIIPEMDYTIEFWFKTPPPQDTICFFSNQKGDGKEGKNLVDKALSIVATADGKILVISQGNVFTAATGGYFNNAWHHFALVVRRTGNVSSFIDGKKLAEKENTLIGGLGGANMYLGVRKWNNLSGSGENFYYNGKLDEFRIWNIAKTLNQIELDANSKLKGDEIGLMLYYPFEGYFEDNMGVVQQQPSLKNYVTDANARDATAKAGNAFSLDAPNMKDVRPVQAIAYQFVASEDKIIINPASYLWPQLEKNLIEITVKNVEDKYGNRMASPVKWLAYVHRNQVRWEDERRTFTKLINEPLTFVASIKNTGGIQIGFTIENLPIWLKANPSSGVINPLSSMEIAFTVSTALNVGRYNQDIVLRTENGFDEKLPLTLIVKKTPPDWKVNPSAFELSMNIVGVVKVEDVLSTDISDMVAAFKAGTDSIRGVASVRFVKELESYLVFMNVYGNVTGEKLEFRIWDASAGQILDQVLPDNLTFAPNDIKGTTANPVVFLANNTFRTYIPLAKGWNWVSFNKTSADQNNLNKFMSSLESVQNDQIKTHGGGFNNFDPAIGWAFGGIETINNSLMYQIKVSNPDTLIYSGLRIEPEKHTIPMVAGWNHVAYIPDFLMDVNEALRLYKTSEAEIIKSQYAFSMYDSRVGWIGTLDALKPNLGYMIKSNAPGSLKYPNTTLLKDAKIAYQTSPPAGWLINRTAYSGNMTLVARIETSKTPEIVINDQMILGAIINNEIHGYTAPIIRAGIEYAPFFLTVSNDLKNQVVKFVLFDAQSGKTYQIAETIIYTENAVYGTILSPLKLTITGLETGIGDLFSDGMLRCFPNPFDNNLTIEYTHNGGRLTVDILDMTGRTITQLYDGTTSPGLKTMKWDGTTGKGVTVSAGMYHIRVTSNKAVETMKVTRNR